MATATKWYQLENLGFSKLEYDTKNTNDKSYFIPARHFLWIPACIPHNITSRSAVTMVFNIFFPTSLINHNTTVATREGIHPVNNLLMEMITYIKNWNGEISIKNTTKYEFLNTMKNIVLEVSKTPLPVVLSTTDDEKLREILRYIHKHISYPQTLSNVSKVFNYGSRTLSHLFQNKIKTSFLQYINLTRIIKSMELLL